MKSLASNCCAAKSHELLCPLCRSQLIVGPDYRYETLGEHVCDPNGARPSRPTLVCPNQSCQASWAKIFWSTDGEGPYHTNFDENYAWIDGNPLPFGSYHRGIYFQCGYHDEDRRFIIGKLMVKRAVTYKSDDYGHKTGKNVHYSIWWNNIHWISGIRMLLFSLGQFYHSKKNGERFVINEVKGIVQRATWPRAEWWRKASCLYVKLFHPTIYKKAS